MTSLVRITSALPREAFVVRIGFSDGTSRDIDLLPFLRGPVFEVLRSDPAEFRKLRVDPRSGTIVWPTGADIDPDVLYHNRRPAWMDPAPSRAEAS